jgi:hypothetical protein
MTRFRHFVYKEERENQRDIDDVPTPACSYKDPPEKRGKERNLCVFVCDVCNQVKRDDV